MLYVASQERLTDKTAVAQSVERLTAPREAVGSGAFHLSELTGQTIPVEMIISLLITTILPDQSNPK